MKQIKAANPSLAQHQVLAMASKQLSPVASRPLGQVGPWPDLKYAKSGQVGPDQDWSGQARFIF